ncbi:unnamed protein product [Closterium sp. NIES-65]|nr:unnamed protein product [Closterium sp. NIES-65]
MSAYPRPCVQGGGIERARWAGRQCGTTVKPMQTPSPCLPRPPPSLSRPPPSLSRPPPSRSRHSPPFPRHLPSRPPPPLPCAGWRDLANTVGGSARESTDRRNGDGDDDGSGGQAVLVRGGRPIAKSMPHAGQPILSFNTGCLTEEYELGEKLGEGHFGSTYRCRQRATGKEFAVKQMSKTRLLMLGTPLAEVKREVGILYHLAGHPHVVQVAAAFEDSKSVAIVMELCHGGELYDRIIAKGHYSECDAARLVSTIVSVVHYCHTMNVVHRDLKPENFLFANRSDDAPLKAIDFGLSLFFTPGEPISAGLAGSPLYIAPEMVRTNGCHYGPEVDVWSCEPISAGLAGSPLYLAPEMVRTNGCHYGPEVDVWSAGVILYMLLCGYCPFPTDLPTMDELFCAIMYDEIDYDSDPWPLISQQAKEVVQGMLDRNPETRLTAKQVLEHPWVSEAGVAPDTPLDPTVFSRLKRYAAMTHIRKLASQVRAITWRGGACHHMEGGSVPSHGGGVRAITWRGGACHHMEGGCVPSHGGGVRAITWRGGACHHMEGGSVPSHGGGERAITWRGGACHHMEGGCVPSHGGGGACHHMEGGCVPSHGGGVRAITWRGGACHHMEGGCVPSHGGGVRAITWRGGACHHMEGGSVPSHGGGVRAITWRGGACHHMEGGCVPSHGGGVRAITWRGGASGCFPPLGRACVALGRHTHHMPMAGPNSLLAPRLMRYAAMTRGGAAVDGGGDPGHEGDLQPARHGPERFAVPR